MKNNNDLEQIFDFLHLAGNLKKTMRFKATKNGPKESVADHSWRLSLMVILMADKVKVKLNVSRAIKIAIAHDLAEAITDDIDAWLIKDGTVKKSHKQKLEKAAIKKIRNMLPKKEAEEIYSLWKEYEEGKTKEALFVKALDKIEAMTTLIESGHKSYDLPHHIANHADEAVKKFPELNEMLKITKQRLRKEFKKGDIPWKKEYD